MTGDLSWPYLHLVLRPCSNTLGILVILNKKKQVKKLKVLLSICFFIHIFAVWCFQSQNLFMREKSKPQTQAEITQYCKPILPDNEEIQQLLVDQIQH